MMTPTKIAAATVLAGAFLMRGPDACTGYASTPDTGPASPVCGVHVIGPDLDGNGKRVADAVNAKNGC